jgi:hypothetical protein
MCDNLSPICSVTVLIEAAIMTVSAPEGELPCDVFLSWQTMRRPLLVVISENGS